VSAISNISATSTAWKPQRPDAAKMSEDLFKKLDADAGGSIDATEMASALSKTGQADSDAAALMKGLDADGDNKVTREELSQGMQKLADQFQAKFNSSRTTHADGAPPAGAAAAAASDKQYEAADKNEDGTVTTQERQAYDAQQAKRAETAKGGSDAALDKLLVQLSKAYSADSTQSGESAVSVTA
jgi:hypothetical protein